MDTRSPRALYGLNRDLLPPPDPAHYVPGPLTLLRELFAQQHLTDESMVARARKILADHNQTTEARG